MRGNPVPRRSVSEPLFIPLSISGLPQSGTPGTGIAIEGKVTGTPFGSNFGSSGVAIAPFKSVGAVNPVLPSATPMRLKPSELKVPETSAPANALRLFLAMTELLTVAWPKMPPPLPRLRVMVLLSTFKAPDGLDTPPPAPTT